MPPAPKPTAVVFLDPALPAPPFAGLEPGWTPVDPDDPKVAKLIEAGTVVVCERPEPDGDLDPDARKAWGEVDSAFTKSKGRSSTPPPAVP